MRGERGPLEVCGVADEAFWRGVNGGMGWNGGSNSLCAPDFLAVVV